MYPHALLHRLGMAVMFVVGHTKATCLLARATLDDPRSIAALLVESVRSIGGDGAVSAPVEDLHRGPDDPPPLAARPLWKGTSVTVAGTVYGPSAPPFLRRVDFRVGRHIRRFVVFGERRWDRRGEAASSPEAFEHLRLDVRQAFGGAYTLPPGPDPATRLPQPGGRVEYALNPAGVGFHPDASAAAGQCLPRVERVEDRVTSWRDQPVPAVMTPCPDLAALRLRGSGADAANEVAPLFRLMHHAPADMIFAGLGAASELELVGVGGSPIRLAIGPSPVDVSAHWGRHAEQLPARVRSVHIDADARTVRTIHAHHLIYPRSRVPSRLEISDREVRQP